MPQFRMAKKVDLGNGAAIYAVRENGNDEVLLTLVEADGAIVRRTRISLTLRQATRLARALTGIACIPELEPDR